MKYGFFDKENKEYVITRPDTPLPWINYLGSESYCGLISNTAGGYSFFKDPKERRITRYRYNNVPMDCGGRYIYIRDDKSKDFWSATWQPVRKSLKDYKYECRHGLGYTQIKSAYAGIETTTTYFVPKGENMEVWMIEVKNPKSEIRNKAKIKNSKPKTRDLTIFPFVEFCLWDALNDMTDYQYNLNIGETEFKNNTIYHLTRYRVEKKFFAYFSCASHKVESFDTQRTNFLGTYGSFSDPEAVIKGECTNSIACGWAPIGAFCLPVQLKPGESQTFVFVLGYNEDREDVKRIIKKFNSPEGVNQSLNELKEYWSDNISHFSAQTEDQDMNLMVNVWNQYQCRTTFNWSRSASYYESGIGRGMGYRDSNQDTLGFSHMIPSAVKARIVDLASAQFAQGNAFHQYSPLTKKGYGSGLTDLGYSDDHLWLILSVANYIKESGDVKFLEEVIPFANDKTGKLYEHLEKAIDFTLNNLGPHGLPRMFFADWNDCLNLPGSNGKAESVMVAGLFVLAAKELSSLALISGRQADVEKYQKIAQKMADQVNEKAWDGEWYIRAFTDKGDPVGSSKNAEGKIHLESQVWSVMSGVAEGERAEKCMNSVKKHLASKYGIMLVQPAYATYRPEIGSVTFYPPGLKENAAIFCHPNPWAMISECILGRGDQAFEYYKAIMPAAYNDNAEIRKTEPYVYCQMIAGRDHKDFGEGKNSWLTGSACWNFVAAANWILGVRPDYNGLVVDPCIPKKWKGMQIKRKFRGADYYITVRNPQQVSKGIKSITVDGKKIDGKIIPVFDDQGEHHIEIIMG